MRTDRASGVDELVGFRNDQPEPGLDVRTGSSKGLARNTQPGGSPADHPVDRSRAETAEVSELDTRREALHGTEDSPAD